MRCIGKYYLHSTTEETATERYDLTNATQQPCVKVRITIGELFAQSTRSYFLFWLPAWLIFQPQHLNCASIKVNGKSPMDFWVSRLRSSRICSL